MKDNGTVIGIYYYQRTGYRSSGVVICEGVRTALLSVRFRPVPLSEMAGAVT